MHKQIDMSVRKSCENENRGSTYTEGIHIAKAAHSTVNVLEVRSEAIL